MITIYLVRHGETRLNNDNDTSQDRIRGWSDVPLTDKGREEAKKAAAKLKPHNIEVIFCSDLSRAEETAQIIGKILKIKPISTKNLRPWDLGKFTGESTKDSLPKIEAYASDTPNKPVPEGESFNSFSGRLLNGISEIINKANGRTICIVTHHRDERYIEAWIKAGQPSNHKIDLKTFLSKGDAPGGVMEFEINENKLPPPTKTKDDSSKLDDRGKRSQSLTRDLHYAVNKGH